MTDREIIKEARDLIVMCGLLDKSGQCNKMADKMDKQLATPSVSNRRNVLIAYLVDERCYSKDFASDEVDAYLRKIKDSIEL